MKDSYELARNLMRDHDLNKAPAALRLLERAAAKGDPRAEYALGTWHLHGFFFRRNVTKGVALIAKAAEQNVPEAAFDLAVSYELGVGRRKSEDKALCYFMRSYLLGHAPAGIELERLFYWGGKGVRNRGLSREIRLQMDRLEA